MTDDKPTGQAAFAILLERAAAELGLPADDPRVPSFAALLAQEVRLVNGVIAGESVSTGELLSLQDRLDSIRQQHRQSEKTLRVIYVDDYAAARIKNNGLPVEYTDDEEGRARREADRREADREIEEEVQKRLKARLGEMLRSGAVVAQQPPPPGPRTSGPGKPDAGHSNNGASAPRRASHPDEGQWAGLCTANGGVVPSDDVDGKLRSRDFHSNAPLKGSPEPWRSFPDRFGYSRFDNRG